ncbi:sugar phosphate nucleotidyltransferase [Streptomyces sp. NPDC002790]|uniref:sugar phosphate nucleotidyltransferase n=1 Tax=Streptomyces sp. NPDC002790 TaxID=3154431 RepID=UPI0033200BB7
MVEDVTRPESYSHSASAGPGEVAVHAIILAGGKGTRLAPYTDDLPKSLIQISEHSILEIIAHQLQVSGFTRLTLCVSHLGEMITERMGDGSHFRLEIDYCWDREPLGTAAPLLLVKDWDTPALVMNCDILTAVDLGALTADHLRSGAYMTVATHRHQVPVDFGVIDSVDGLVHGIREKPRISLDVSAGIQVIDPRARECIPPGERMDMPQLVAELLGRGHQVRSFHMAEPWHDIGTPTSLHAAKDAVSRSPERYRLPGASWPVSIDRHTALATAGRSGGVPSKLPGLDS